MSKEDEVPSIQNCIGIDFITSYYRDRYEETKASYRRLEDKVNYLLAVVGVEVSALMAIFSTVDFNSDIAKTISYKIALLLLFSCVISIIVCFYYLWRSWNLKPMLHMPTHVGEKPHDFLLFGDKVATLRYHMHMYGKAVNSLQEQHAAKAVYVRKLFNCVALSFGYFILSLTFLVISKA